MASPKVHPIFSPSFAGLALCLALLLLCLVGSTTAFPSSMMKNIELRQQKFCQLEVGCYNCSLAIEHELLVNASRLIAGELAKTDKGSGQLESFAGAEEKAVDAMQACAIPRFRDPQQYCCQLWSAFDCRSRIAAEQCTFMNYIKYRKNLVAWANDLMLLNVCVDFDYGSKSCEQQLRQQQLEQQQQQQPQFGQIA